MIRTGKGFDAPKQEGWTTLEAVLAVSAVGALGAGLAVQASAGKCTSDMSEDTCRAVQQKRDLGTTSMVVGALAGLLLLTEMGARALPAPAKQ